ncbi:MAG: hypothetical protein WCT10_05560 [Patescibacteria group bacterium]|jgi:hypothetical protein
MKKILGSLFALAIAAMLWPSGASAITISPIFVDYSLDPGDTVMDVLKAYNENPFPITLYPVVDNFTSGDEEGSPVFYDADEDPYGTALATWVKMDSTEPFTLQPGDRVNLPFSINVPVNAQPGGHFGAIILSTQPPEISGEGVGVAAQIGMLIFVDVSGEAKETASIAEFGFKNPRVWYNYLPVNFFLRFENSGNTHLRPTGNLFIKDMFGRQVASIPVNSDFRSVLPSSIRKFEFGWRRAAGDSGSSELLKEWNNFAFGKYEAMLVLNYGKQNKIVTDTREFYVWPWRILCIAGGIILLLILLFIGAMKLYKRSIIKKYQKDNNKK